MRSALIILCTVILLGGAFAIYSWLQPPAAKKPNRSLTGNVKTQRPQLDQTLRGVGSGENVWVKKYDTKTGELQSQFRGQKYDPQKDGTVLVDSPEAEFFNSDGGQRIRIEGATGNVVMQLPPQDKNSKLEARDSATMPSRGTLKTVTISIFEPADSDEPTLVAKMNNAAFDTDTFRIATESFIDEKGNKVEADEVPVVLRGKDYDFDGRGLVIRWNERDRKLELLEIAHGESLVVKNPAALENPELAPATQPAADAGPVDMLVSADPGSARLLLAAAKSKPKRSGRRPAHPATAPATTTKTIRDLTPVVYRATFERDVRIFEGEQQIVQTAGMNIDLLQGSGDKSGAATQPAENAPAKKHPTTSPAIASDDATTQPASKHTRRKTAGTDDSASPTTMPAPIIVKWTGKLRVVPLEGPRDPSLLPGKAIVRMAGAPTVLTRDGTRATCASATFNSADSSGSLLSSAAVPIVTMVDARGATVTTPQLNYLQSSPNHHVALLIGQSRAEIPVEGDNGSKQTVTATWSKDGRFLMTDSPGEKGAARSSTITHADMTGDVTVDHPQMNLLAETLSLDFDPTVPTSRRSATTAASAPATTRSSTENAAGDLRDIVASGNVRCRMIDEQQQPRTIAANQLRVDTARGEGGQVYAKQLQADGNVVTSENGKELRAGHLTADLEPATRPAKAPATTQAASEPATQPGMQAATMPATTQTAGLGGGNVRLVSMLATQNVLLTSDDGTKASAEQLIVETIDDQPVYRLIGNPNASVSDGKSTVIGPTIRFAPGQQLAQIIGGGSIDGADPKNPKQTMRITWAGDASIDGNTNWIDVDKDVTVNSTQVDGTVNGATARHLRAKLEPKPTTQATTEPATEPGPVLAAATTKPSRNPADESVSFLKDKDISAATLSGKVEVKSELKNPDGSLARGLNLFAEQVNYDRASGRFDVPMNGQMLYQDHRAGAQTSEGPTVGSGRGATAFDWNKSLVYRPDAKQAVMTGNVKVVHHPDVNSGQPFNLNAETITAEMEPDPTATTKPAATQVASTTPATTNPADEMEKLRLKKVTADGDVHVTSSRLNVDAAHLTYDPQEQVLIATGADRKPLTVFDNASGSTTQAGELWWNTKTDQFKVRELVGKARR